MEVRILEERTNPLLKRHELKFEVTHATAATPTRESVRTELAKAVNAHKERVIIERMVPRFGTAVTRGDANVYDTADAAKAITREHILVRNGLKEKTPKGPAAAPAAPTPTSEAPAATPAAPPEAPSASSAAATPAAAPAAEGGSEPAPAAEAPKKGKPHAKKE